MYSLNSIHFVKYKSYNKKHTAKNAIAVSMSARISCHIQIRQFVVSRKQKIIHQSHHINNITVHKSICFVWICLFSNAVHRINCCFFASSSPSFAAEKCHLQICFFLLTTTIKSLKKNWIRFMRWTFAYTVLYECGGHYYCDHLYLYFIIK